MTISDASGISMPTSMTVVETRICIFFLDKVVHDPILFGCLHTSVNETDPAVRKDLFLQMLRHPCGILEVQIFRLFDKRIDDEYLISLLNFTADDFIDAVSLGFGKHLRSDRLSCPEASHR